MTSPVAPSSQLTGNSPAAIKRRRRALLLFICLLVLTAGAARAQEAKTSEATEARAGASRTGTITGRVVGEDGRPLADTVISFYRPYAMGMSAPLTATSDIEGKFKVSGIEPGLYTAQAMLPGFVNPLDSSMDESQLRYFRLGDFVNLTLVKGGVITGTVRDANGEPVIAVSVRAIRVREAAGRAAVRFSGFFPERMTDDRGVYRIYGLPPGTYVVSAGGSQRPFGMLNAYEGDAPTYFPSSTRDTAVEVPVQGGEEATGIDIRYRGERGHIISGTVSGVVEANMQYGISIVLKQTSSGGYAATTFVGQGMKHGFSFNGIADGEYELTAQQWGGASDSVASIPRRVTVKGANVTGIELALTPLASIGGRVNLEAAPKDNCGEQRNANVFETVINARRDEKTQAGDIWRTPFFAFSGSVPNAQGDFTIRNLIAGNYRLTTRLPVETWYVRSIALPGAAVKPAEPRSAAAVASLITLKAGERVTNVAVNIAQDGATLRGRVLNRVGAAEGATLPDTLKVYLVPAERERADDTLRYAEASAEDGGAFALLNIAPGRYWLVARSIPENESRQQTPRPLAWDAEARAKLRREAEAANTAIELKPCQRLADYELRFAPPAAKP